MAGPPGTERDVARRYLAVRGKLAEAGLTLESLELDERGAWRLVLGGGQEIRLGRRDIDERLYRFFDVVAPALAADLKGVATWTCVTRMALRSGGATDPGGSCDRRGDWIGGREMAALQRGLRSG